MTAQGRLCIGGEWIEGAGGAFTSHNPADGSPLWEGRAASPAQVADAVAAARAAFRDWRRVPLDERIAILERYAALVEERREELARAIAEETGKPLWDARGEAGAMAAKVRISIAAHEERTPTRRREKGAIVQHLTHRPHGVMAVFGPFNFPGHLPNGHIVPALLAGNTIVFKPSELTPRVAELLVRLLMEAGVPEGVVNLVHGGREVGAALLDQAVDGVLFTGSREAGLAIHRHFAGRPEVILALEMGGNNPLIVWDAADAQAAALLIVQSAFITTGQRCTCARRLILPEGAAGDGVLDALVALAERLRVDRFDAEPEPFMGPLISEAAALRLLDAVKARIAAGARAILPLARLLDKGPAFVTPAILDVTGVPVPDGELFGPVLQVIRVADFDAALEAANDTMFGLAAGLISDDEGLFRRFAEEIAAGVIAWNRPTAGASSELPFGGIKQSGNHRPSAWYAADYCAWPQAGLSAAAGRPVRPAELPPGIAAD
ncbi:MAG: N-succinylglutamate 5-semialdehyde dehydrogenase [Rhodothalassiaceae bacterium]|nr:MAG: N-succinylglutamate 5-semialdehyde dehydrogenase [Rhodothalassiaceae bacterium]